ncbi:MAG: HAMP domain-containing histidine kinase [Pseudomonadota bacterium]|nr:HAMP domain-containing histidine kinase [Pseudomonadota bacterium]
MDAPLSPHDAPEALARDVEAVSRIGAIPAMLRLVCQNTGMGFAAVARVTDGSWVACAVHDEIGFGLVPGGSLDVSTTLCKESRDRRGPITIVQASADPVYRDHHTPRLYGIESYISVPIVLANGDYFGNLCAIDPGPAPRLDDPKAVAMFDAFAQLISMQLDAEAGREDAEARLASERAAGELREHFVAVLGHDLRNPLSGIMAASELLMRRESEPEGARTGRVIRRMVKRMSNLIDDVLDLTRARLGGGIGIQREVADDVGPALAEVIEELRLANPRRIFAEAIGPCGPLICDRGRLQQLLSNLIGNALVHGDPLHPVAITAGVEGPEVVFSVLNFGKPIGIDSLPKIFEPYWRPDGSAPRGGLGLGLFICAQIARAHGGSIEVCSEQSDGTRFVVRLPLLAASAPESAVTSVDLAPI